MSDAKLRMRLFKNKHKEANDKKPPYSNSNFTVPETVTLEKGKSYSLGMWKDENHDAVNIRCEERQEFGGSGQGGENNPTQVHESPPPQDDDIPF
tara:strand:+ start:190 stop:474 length:285 start_codon:yes stop_codon:yes gene_type:complete